jgi:methylmalonyl-CoA mutase
MSVIEKNKTGVKIPIRIVTAAALFDGHDASINIMRRILQASGVEVIHLGHNRSVEEVVNAAIQEDAQGIAVTSYQGGHMEFFTYMRQMLDERGAGHIRIFGGGGGVIVPKEIEELHKAGIDRIFSPEDGRKLGLQGMIDLVIKGCSYDPLEQDLKVNGSALPLARNITIAERGDASHAPYEIAGKSHGKVPVIGLTGTGGAGKSSLTDELVRRFINDFPDKRIAVICVDPTKRRTGGALLGDRIRFNTLKNPRVFLRSLATRESQSEISDSVGPVIDAVREAGYDLILVETAGIGQGDSAITQYVDMSLYVMTAEYGAPSQLEKIEMLDYADFVVINKFSRRGSEDALRDVRKQYQRNREAFHQLPEELPVFGTNAAQFNDNGVTALYAHMIAALNERFELGWTSQHKADKTRSSEAGQYIIAPGRERYLSEISELSRKYRKWAEEQAGIAGELDALQASIVILGGPGNTDWKEYDASSHEAASDGVRDLMDAYDKRLDRLDNRCRKLLREWHEWSARYDADKFIYKVRGRDIEVDTKRETLSGNMITRVARPKYHSAADRLLWRLLENVPGEFPYTSGTFPFKRDAEDPTRMFAGEGPAQRTNKRFHYLAEGQPAKRLSTAFDSITLYGEEPDRRPDIYGKIGESGVAIFTTEEAERLYAGFDLISPDTSVSMTINGPAPTVLAFYMIAATRQQCRRFLREAGRLDITEEQVLQPDNMRGAHWDAVRALLSDEEYLRIRSETMSQVRGTVQADILKEDQGQNTCLFSTEFSLKLMGDVQEYFSANNVRNFYSVSISGYHIAEAGANPIHQLAFTLANGFTYVEYYLSRGMDINEFAPNLSFFFSNGMDTEYTVIGRVARRIWAMAMRDKYGADARSQMLKYHIQTSGRSLHAMEMEFNDIRTTLQALLAIYDNAQSLHTNAFDEAITTPTRDSVRRAMAIQLIINREFGKVFCENSTQGSFLVEQLTDLVEAEVLKEFDRISERGGVLGAMERQYQRGEIQDDSLKYERMKHDGKLPIVGVNTFFDSEKNYAKAADVELSRASTEEKEGCIARLASFHAHYESEASEALSELKRVSLANGNVFAELLNCVQFCSLGQITHALFEVGGEYRRNL